MDWLTIAMYVLIPSFVIFGITLEIRHRKLSREVKVALKRIIDSSTHAAGIKRVR